MPLLMKTRELIKDDKLGFQTLNPHAGRLLNRTLLSNAGFWWYTMCWEILTNKHALVVMLYRVISTYRRCNGIKTNENTCSGHFDSIDSNKYIF